MISFIALFHCLFIPHPLAGLAPLISLYHLLLVLLLVEENIARAVVLDHWFRDVEEQNPYFSGIFGAHRSYRRPLLNHERQASKPNHQFRSSELILTSLRKGFFAFHYKGNRSVLTESRTPNQIITTFEKTIAHHI